FPLFFFFLHHTALTQLSSLSLHDALPISPGPYHLTIRANGYLQSRTEITVKAGLQTSDVRVNPELHFSEVTSVSPEAKSQFESLDRKSTRLNSSHVSISYAVFCLKKKKKK